MSKKIEIGVRVISMTGMLDVINFLQESNINYKISKSLDRTVVLDKIRIKFIIVPIGIEDRRKTDGFKFDGCFGFDDKVSDYLTNFNNICNGYDLYDYIKGVECDESNSCTEPTSSGTKTRLNIKINKEHFNTINRIDIGGRIL